MTIDAPTWRLVGVKLGLALSRDATVVPNLAAIAVNVSPGWITYVDVGAVGGVG